MTQISSKSVFYCLLISFIIATTLILTEKTLINRGLWILLFAVYTLLQISLILLTIPDNGGKEE